MNYQQQANDFAKKHGITLKINGLPEFKKHFADDKEKRCVFSCTLRCNKRQFTFSFGQSIAAGNKQPEMYDILSCLQKYDIGTFENFCGDFGYNEDSRKAEKIYKAVAKEYENMCRLFTPEQLEEMSEIN